MSAGVASNLKDMVLGVQVITPMVGKQLVKVANGTVERVKQKLVLPEPLYPNWGPVVLDPCPYAVMPGIKDDILMRNPTLKTLGIDVCGSLGACAQAINTSVRSAETPEFKDCRRVNTAVDALQQPDGREEPVFPRSSGCCQKIQR